MNQPFQHTNRSGDVYTLFQGTTKTGKPKYFVSRKDSANGTPITEIPEGFEIYENPNAIVSVRRIPKQVILYEERDLVVRGVAKNKAVRHFRVELEKQSIVVYTAGDSVSNDLRSFLTARHLDMEAESLKWARFTADMRFTLVDKENRFFIAERYCWRGRIDDWIEIAGPDSLEKHGKEFLRHLGCESLYELY